MTDVNQNPIEFYKYLKFFTNRTIQIVVQSRQGQKQKFQCDSSTDNHDWFNVKVDELGEIAAEIKRKLQNIYYPPKCDCICVDFHVRTADGELLPVEVWCVRVDTNIIDPTVSVRTQLYHQLGTMLKSTIAVSRVTPTYRHYARKQVADSFVICYQIYHGQPTLSTLGEAYRTVSIGSLPSPFGAISLTLYYRTKMVISSGEQDRLKDATADVNVSQVFSPQVTRRDSEQKQQIDVKRKGSQSSLAQSPLELCSLDFYASPATSPAERSSLQSLFNRERSSTTMIRAQSPVFGNQYMRRSLRQTVSTSKVPSIREEIIYPHSYGSTRVVIPFDLRMQEDDGEQQAPSQITHHVRTTSQSSSAQSGNAQQSSSDSSSRLFHLDKTSHDSSENIITRTSTTLASKYHSTPTLITSHSVPQNMKTHFNTCKAEKTPTRDSGAGMVKSNLFTCDDDVFMDDDSPGKDSNESSFDNVLGAFASITFNRPDDDDLSILVQHCKDAPQKISSFEKAAVNEDESMELDTEISGTINTFEQEKIEFDDFIDKLKP